jgi:hypothetical protein
MQFQINKQVIAFAKKHLSSFVTHVYLISKKCLLQSVLTALRQSVLRHVRRRYDKNITFAPVIFLNR